jgi:hypothetical protein
MALLHSPYNNSLHYICYEYCLHYIYCPHCSTHSAGEDPYLGAPLMVLPNMAGEDPYLGAPLTALPNMAGEDPYLGAPLTALPNMAGEDPYLGAPLTAAYVRGVQSEKVAAVVKHFVLNNQVRLQSQQPGRINVQSRS